MSAQYTLVPGMEYRIQNVQGESYLDVNTDNLAEGNGYHDSDTQKWALVKAAGPGTKENSYAIRNVATNYWLGVNPNSSNSRLAAIKELTLWDIFQTSESTIFIIYLHQASASTVIDLSGGGPAPHTPITASLQIGSIRINQEWQFVGDFLPSSAT